jgi:hypothetical protein
MTNHQDEYEQQAIKYEKKAKRVTDAWVRDKYLTLAKHCRETKRIPRRRARKRVAPVLIGNRNCRADDAR